MVNAFSFSIQNDAVLPESPARAALILAASCPLTTTVTGSCDPATSESRPKPVTSTTPPRGAVLAPSGSAANPEDTKRIDRPRIYTARRSLFLVRPRAEHAVAVSIGLVSPLILQPDHPPADDRQ